MRLKRFFNGCEAGKMSLVSLLLLSIILCGKFSCPSRFVRFMHLYRKKRMLLFNFMPTILAEEIKHVWEE